MPMPMTKGPPPGGPGMMPDQEDDAFYSKPKPEEAEEPTSVDEEAEQSPTALLPTSALGGNVKVGDTVTVRVVKVYDDEAEVEITTGTTTPPAEGETRSSADEELDNMEKEY